MACQGVDVLFSVIRQSAILSLVHLLSVYYTKARWKSQGDCPRTGEICGTRRRQDRGGTERQKNGVGGRKVELVEWTADRLGSEEDGDWDDD